MKTNPVEQCLDPSLHLPLDTLDVLFSLYIAAQDLRGCRKVSKAWREMAGEVKARKTKMVHQRMMYKPAVEIATLEDEKGLGIQSSWLACGDRFVVIQWKHHRFVTIYRTDGKRIQAKPCPLEGPWWREPISEKSNNKKIDENCLHVYIPGHNIYVHSNGSLLTLGNCYNPKNHVLIKVSTDGNMESVALPIVSYGDTSRIIGTICNSRDQVWVQTGTMTLRNFNDYDIFHNIELYRIGKERMGQLKLRHVINLKSCIASREESCTVEPAYHRISLDPFLLVHWPNGTSLICLVTGAAVKFMSNVVPGPGNYLGHMFGGQRLSEDSDHSLKTLCGTNGVLQTMEERRGEIIVRRLSYKRLL